MRSLFIADEISMRSYRPPVRGVVVARGADEVAELVLVIVKVPLLEPVPFPEAPVRPEVVPPTKPLSCPIG